MKNLLEPKSLLEVRKWKERASKEIEKHGMATVGKRAAAKLDRMIAEANSKKRLKAA
jgi:hypothetical protein